MVAATSSIEVNDAVYREARRRQILCNVVDDPDRCDFYYPAVVRRGDLQIAISTAGKSPALAQRLRREFEAQLAPIYAGWIEELGRVRKQLFGRRLNPEDRRKRLHELASRESFEARAAITSATGPLTKGKVFLVGAGPGDPELLTVKALRVLETAQVVLHDDLISPEILALIPRSAEVRNVGKRCGRNSTPQQEINSLLVTLAAFGLKVVRLKGGDPSIFGRAGEEMNALRKANVEFEVVPGVTSALASAASAQISLTQRDKASAVIFLTSHHANSKETIPWQAFVSSGATLAIYMPGFDYEQTSTRLIAAGLKSETPCAIISRASSRDQQIHRTTVRDLPSAPLLPAPTLLLVGDVVQTEQLAATPLEAWNLATEPLPQAPVEHEVFDRALTRD
ncbi:MAG: uroporphyrinogen-III C-methyltransferase [Acidobacteria bacterium]|nr:MAG: uroporphyrinogen-III C-methyltransferase [Acidobacteriota bacterium]